MQVLQAPTPSPLGAASLFHNANGPEPGSACEFEDDTGLFHWVEKDVLVTATNSDGQPEARPGLTLR